MIVWVDAQLSPAIAQFIEQELGVSAVSARRLGMLKAIDRQIFEAAKAADAVVLTKDRDFLLHLERLGPPPKILWLRCGNTSNAHLRGVLKRLLPAALGLIEAGENVVEIVDGE